MIGDLVAYTRILSATINDKLNGLADGSLDLDSNKLENIRKETQTDHIIVGMLASGYDQNLTINSGVAKINGKRVIFRRTTFVCPKNNDTYIDAAEDGSLVMTSVGYATTEPPLATGTAFRVTGYALDSNNAGIVVQFGTISAVGVLRYPQGSVTYDKTRAKSITVFNQDAGTLPTNSWSAQVITIPNGMSMRTSKYHVDYTIQGESYQAQNVRYIPGIAYSANPSQFVIFVYASYPTGGIIVGCRISYSLYEADNW